MADKERRINERSLENLKLGAQARYQGKIRQNVSILPETAQWLKCSGNASGMIDDLVAAARSGGLKSNHTHEKTEVENQQSDNVYEQIEALKAEGEQWITGDSQVVELQGKISQLENQLTALQEELAHWKAKALEAEIVIPNLEDELDLLKEELTQVKTQQADFEAARDRALAKLRLGKQAPEYKRAKKAMDLFLGELRG